MSERKLPDPNGRPRAVDAGFGLVDLIAGVAAAGVSLFMLVGFLTPTMGATRSTRLKWQERQNQVDEAVKTAVDERP
jgi:hypothetical protein